jgi:membrane protease YdiL (CAAX protease family)
VSQPPYPPPPPGPPDRDPLPGSGDALVSDDPFTDPVDLHDPSAQGAFRVPFSIWDALVALFVYFVGQLIAGLVLGVGMAVTGRVPASTETLAVAVAAQVLGLLLAGLYLLLRRRLTWRILGPVRPSALSVAIGLGVGVGGTLLAYLLNGVLSLVFEPEAPVEQQLLQDILAGGWATVLGVIAAVVMAPIAEEVLFRGLLFQALRRRTGLWVAAGLSSLVFTAVHVEIVTSQPLALVGLFALGVLFAWSFHRSGSLVVPIIGHAVFNGVSLTLALAVDRFELDELIGWLHPALGCLSTGLPGS